MKKHLTFFLVVVVAAVLVFSCKKKDDNSNVQKTPLVFTSLTASDSVMTKYDYTTLTAVASGDELTYTWGSQSGYGTFVGSGPVVSWSVCHEAVFILTCDVQDKYGDKLSKSIKIYVKP